MDKYILSLDQGTTSSRAIVFDKKGNIISTAQKEFTQIFPKPGWVEHDPQEIWSTQAGVAAESIANKGLKANNIAAIGITNQRETVVAWDRESGKPLARAIVWQDRRTAPFCKEVREAGHEDADYRRRPQGPAYGEGNQHPEIPVPVARWRGGAGRAAARGLGIQRRGDDPHAGNTSLPAAPEDRTRSVERAPAGNGIRRLSPVGLIAARG